MTTPASSTQEPEHLDRGSVKEVMRRYDTVMLDCDGVLWGSNHTDPLEGRIFLPHKITLQDFSN